MGYFPLSDLKRTFGKAAVVGVCCMAAACTGNSKLSKQDIQIAASDLRSLANASSLLIDQSESGNTTSIFVKSQSQLLSKKFDSVGDGLDGNAGEYDVERIRLREIGQALAIDLKDLSPDKRPHINAMGREALVIEEKLKE